MSASTPDYLYIYLVAAIITLLVGASFAIEPRRLRNGLLINFALFVDMVALAIFIINSNNMFLIAPSVIIFLIVMFAALAVFGLHLVFLIWNAIIVWRKEGHSLGNMLTLLLAVALIALDVFTYFSSGFLPNYISGALNFMTITIIWYLLFSLFNFLTVLVAYNFRWHRHNVDFIIVLGAGLIGGHKVSRLLGARIDTAIQFYNKQRALGRPAPLLVFSGGQGPDEQLSEASAMCQYALDHGIPESATLLEDKSRTTMENMLFSKALISQTAPGKMRILFSTNNYHLFRAGLFAKRAGLNANGIGAPTALYFLPNAIIREYIAIFMTHKRRHLVVIGGIILLAVGSVVLHLLSH